MPSFRTLGASVACAAALWAAPAGADEFHYADAVIGGRAAGMGGAVVGVDEDGAAPFHNPAAVSRDPKPEVQVSAQVLQWRSFTYDSFLGQSVTGRSIGIVPNTTVASYPFRGGRASLAVFTTQANDLTLDRVFAPDTTSGLVSARLRRVESERTYLMGPSVGVPLTPVLSVGVTIAYVYRTVTLREQEYVEVAGEAGAVTARSRGVDSDQVSQGLTLIAGVRVQPTGPRGRWTLGLTLRSGASLADLATRREEVFLGTRQADGTLVFTPQPVQDSSQGRTGNPSSVSVGSSVRLGDFRLAASALVHAAQRYESLGVTVEKQLVVNGALGVEWQGSPTWTLRAGAYSNRSAAPRLDRVAEPRFARIDLYGLTFGGTRTNGIRQADVALRITRGDGEAPLAGTSGKVSAVSVSTWEVGFTLGGSTRF